MKNVRSVVHACDNLRDNFRTRFLSDLNLVTLNCLVSSAACLTLDEAEHILLLCILWMVGIALFF